MNIIELVVGLDIWFFFTMAELPLKWTAFGIKPRLFF